MLRSMDKLARSTKESETLLRSLIAKREGINLRPMFGNLSAFVGGNMCLGVYGEDLFLRLSEADRAELLRAKGASIFEPIRGRQMKEYVIVPRSWAHDPSKLEPWITRSLEWASRLPAKGKKR
jgi:TfoX/Sxy family transcriptional regulator of competence genes